MRVEAGRQEVGGTPVYRARPAGTREPLPAVVVIQEVWGVDEHIEDLTRRFAEAGYLAVAPDLYAEGGRRPDVLADERISVLKRFLDTAPPTVWTDPSSREGLIAARPAEEREELRGTMAAVLNPNRPIPRYLETLRGVAAALRESEECTGRVVSTGYCFGGLLSALLAGADPELSGAAVYYGSPPQLTAMEGLACALIGFYGEDDTRITAAVPAFAEALRGAGKEFEAHVYPATPHAFFNDLRPSYRVGPARDAWARTLSFFARVTDGAGAREIRA
ncbi:MAG: dienelactone hydrolase family protein [Gemmatimonadetes bacterium]|nr:dienelactone hydrolase family protein [Gemmatimonadota bacterium]